MHARRGWVRQHEAVEIDPLIYGYRRNSSEPTGALRTSFVESIAMEQLEGGKFQIMARTASGFTTFITEVLPNLPVAQEMLESMRLFLGREGPIPEMPSSWDD